MATQDIKITITTPTGVTIAEQALAQMHKVVGTEYTAKTIPDGYTFTPNADGSATITGEYIEPVVEEEEVINEEPVIDEKVIEE